MNNAQYERFIFFSHWLSIENSFLYVSVVQLLNVRPSKSKHFIVISYCLLLQGRILAETSVSSRDKEDGAGRRGGQTDGRKHFNADFLTVCFNRDLAEIQRKR